MVPADHFAATPSCGHWNFLMYVLGSVALCSVPHCFTAWQSVKRQSCLSIINLRESFISDKSFSDCAKSLAYLVALVPILVT